MRSTCTIEMSKTVLFAVHGLEMPLELVDIATVVVSLRLSVSANRR